MFVAYFSALLCVVTRAFLNVIDRSMFKNAGDQFSHFILCNAFFPFLVALLVCLCFNGVSLAQQMLWMPGVILSGAGAQLAAYFFSRGFQQMNVKSVVVASKGADLFIPVISWALGQSFVLHQYLFSFLSTAIFFPIFKNLFAKETVFNWRIAAQLLFCLCFQAVVNYLFQIPALATSWGAFFSLMTVILFWRMIFVVGVILLRSRNWTQIWRNSSAQTYLSFFLRAILAFVSQAAFFYSITRVDGFVSWPVLNAGPLLSCYIAHFLLRETMEKNEKRVATYFVLISLIYVYAKE